MLEHLSDSLVKVCVELVSSLAQLVAVAAVKQVGFPELLLDLVVHDLKVEHVFLLYLLCNLIRSPDQVLDLTVQVLLADHLIRLKRVSLTDRLPSMANSLLRDLPVASLTGMRSLWVNRLPGLELRGPFLLFRTGGQVAGVFKPRVSLLNFTSFFVLLLDPGITEVVFLVFVFDFFLFL